MIDSLSYHRGSATKAIADDGDGNMNTGSFDNRLVCFLYADGNEEPTMILVQCMNGMFKIINGGDFERLMTSSSMVFEFTIGEGESLLNHVGDYRTAIRIANSFGLPVLANGHLISTDAALLLENSTDDILVGVRVFPGDRFNLNTWNLDRQGRTISAVN